MLFPKSFKSTTATLVRLTLLLQIKYLVRLFYSCRSEWVGEKGDFSHVRIAVLLNHTSLFEPIFIALVSNNLVWRIAARCIAPGADITMNRPFAGRIYRWLASDMISISRKRDETWEQFKDAVREDAVIVFLPEGRMKRPDGKDKHGHPMTVRRGIAEVLPLIGSGKMLFCYSGGLHQVQAPGQKLPKLFKSIAMNFETIEIADYLKQFAPLEGTRFADAIATDMERRRDLYCPPAT